MISFEPWKGALKIVQKLFNRTVRTSSQLLPGHPIHLGKCHAGMRTERIKAGMAREKVGWYLCQGVHRAGLP